MESIRSINTSNLLGNYLQMFLYLKKCLTFLLK
jgi:hypothetical protein